MDEKKHNTSFLGDYLAKKAQSLGISESKLSKLIYSSHSVSFIAGLKFGRDGISEKKIRLIAKIFNEDPNVLIFMSNKIPEKIQEMIFNNKKIQNYLIQELNNYEKSPLIN